MTAGDRVPLAVHICTRDRAGSVRLLLADLASVLDGLGARVTLYDDSTTAPSRDACRAVCDSAALQVGYFGEAQRRRLLASAAAALPSARDCLEVSRPFGTPGWDLAGVRSSAMLAAALDRGLATTHLFLDDDIRVAACSYAGESFAVDVHAVREVLRTEAGGDGLFAAGAPFVGRADLSVLEHFEAFLDGVVAGERGALAGLRGSNPPAGTGPSPSFPVVVTSAPHVHPDSPGISGGFLVTSQRALRTVPLAKTYNEDWIWLRQLAAAGGTIRGLDVSVVHAGPEHFRLSEHGLFLQFEGELRDLALARSGGSATSAAGHVDGAFRSCAERLDVVADKARRASARVSGLGPAVASLEAALTRVRKATPAAYAEGLAEHLHRSCRWRDAFAALDLLPTGV